MHVCVMNVKSFSTITKWSEVLSSRLALNIYFWVILILLKHSDADDQHAYSPWIYYGLMLFFMSFFAFISYFNNLVVLPKLLLRGKRFLYFIITPCYVFLVAFFYTFLLKYIPTIMPGMVTLEMSIVMDPFSGDLSVAGVLEDIQTYFVMMLVWVTLFSLLAIYHYNSKKVKAMQIAIAKHQEAELHFLKNQLNPHFLFNTLNNLYALSLKKSDETPEAIIKLSTVLRYMLYEADVNLVSFEQEKEIMQAYIDIELLRIKQTVNLQFAFTADKEYQIPPLLWLPILENVFKHTRNVAEPEIDFSFSIIGNKLHLQCKNTFVPSTQNQNIKEGGIGLTNLTKRLQLIYPHQHVLSQQISNNTYFIEVIINPVSK